MDEAYRSRALAPRDHALMANALRLQNRWSEAAAVLEKHADAFPAEIRPYADMTLILAREKLGKYAEAFSLAARLEKTAPEDLRYPLAYARFRLLESSSSSGKPPRGEPPRGKLLEGLEDALKKMLSAAETKSQKIAALSRLIKLPGDRSADAIRLLAQQPADKAAHDILSALPEPWSAPVNLALGEYAYLKNDYKTAAERLAAVPQKAAGRRKAVYYRAYSLYRLKRHSEALNLWGSLALSGNAYAESSARRIAALAGTARKPGPLRAEAEAVLRRLVKERKGRVQARAMFALAGLAEDEEAKKLEAGLIQAYPDSIETVKILWKRGWESWNARKMEEAARYWQRAYSPGLDAAWRPRILYWLGAAQKSAGNAAEAEKTHTRLTRGHPLSCYAFLARPGAPELRDGDPPNLASAPSRLEEWGFVLYAKLRMQRPKASAKELYRSIELSEWLGEEGGGYAQARLLARYFTSGKALYRKGLERLYPRSFRRQVEAACEKYGVEDNFVWAVMRQESAFSPRATSRAGASGLMQLMPGTAGDEAKRIGLKKYDIYDVTDNVTLGTAHLARLGKSFERKDWVMAAYNAGAGNARKWLADGRRNLTPGRWIEEIRFDETCDYVQKVSGNLEVYRMLYGAPDAEGDGDRPDK
ncbi:MAG: transglycosylase SLT domain-containing protein [Synergistaceae bacterium]|nr:transglycosylase SLT domain-containing protein [Synergistaceae bacterium]